MMPWLIALLVALLLSLPYALAHWMVYQGMKAGTTIPCGAFTVKYGFIIAVVAKVVCFLAVTGSAILLHWWALIVVPIMWFVAGRLATYLEGAVYARDRLDALDYHAHRMVEQYGNDRALELLQSAVPRWWLNLMSSDWREVYKGRVGSVLKSTDPTDILFDREKFNSQIQHEKA